MKKKVTFALFAILLEMSARALGSPLEIRALLTAAEKNDARLRAAGARVDQAEKSVEVAKSTYYPKVDLEAIDSTGFPGSSGLLGVGGLMGSPFRSGLGYGAVASMTVLDFGRTSSAVEAARHRVGASEADLKVWRMRVYRDALHAYFDCVVGRTEQERYAELEAQASEVMKEISKYIRTGQRSIVDRYLAESQNEEISTGHATAKEQTATSLHRLALATGTPSEGIECPTIEAIDEKSLDGLPEEKRNPFVARAEMESAAARSEEDRARSDFYPKLIAVGSLGNDTNARLVDKESYSAGVGLVLPVFEGFRTRNEVARAEARVVESEHEIAVARDRIAELDARYDEAINTNRVRVSHLEHEGELAHTAFAVARRRYRSLQGNLIDVRESIRNLLRVEIQYVEARGALLLNLSLKRVADGGHV